MQTLLRRCLVALLVALLAVGVDAQDAPRVLDRGDILLSDSAQPPPDSAAWQPVSLPDFWPSTRPTVFGYAWYRLRFELRAQPDEPQAVMATRLRSIGAVYVNGRLVGQNGEWEQEPRPRRAVPVLYPFDAGLLRAGENEVHIRLRVRPDWPGRLSGVRIGDKATVVQAFEHERFLTVTVTQMAGVFSLTIGIGTLLIWLLRRREEMFGYFCIAALSMGLEIFQALGWLEWAPQPITGEVIWFFLVGPGTAALFVYCLRFACWRWPRTERAVWLLTAIIWLIDVSDELFPGHALPGNGNPLFGLPLWEVSFAASSALMAYVWYRKPGLESALLTLAHVHSTVAPAWEILRGDLGGVGLRITHIVPLFLVMGWIITRRFARSLTDAERLNATLERRVEAKRAEIASRAEQVQQLTRQQALADERCRIMTDMHDGIGGQLISALSLVEHGNATPQQIAGALRECIDDLRLTVDSMEPTDHDLLPALGNLRYRLDARLRAIGLTLDWHAEDLPKLARLTPQHVLHVLRILQEAFTNIIKHARADTISVDAGVDPSGSSVLIRVRDNGRGFDGEGHGRGLANMHQRARAMGGQLQIVPSPQGTILSLSLPIV